eukprot:TRINITY_DN385_c0_g1_i2.p1 TRINITY_DN385_c0_g1~~TRINITY_DN385_c0_g1_i2.p1  ORF type:complete len:666 (+),score=151.61 TRINITY_DN385_c0_g1_i2:1414-3411(+)
MFLRGMKESVSRVVKVFEPWTFPTFAVYIATLYCYDFAKASKVLNRVGTVDNMDLSEFIEITQIYQQQNMYNECLMSLTLRVSEFGMDLETVSALFEMVASTATKSLSTVSWKAERVDMTSTFPHLPCFVYGASNTSSFFVGHQGCALDRGYDYYFKKANQPVIPETQVFPVYSEYESGILRYIGDNFEELVSNFVMTDEFPQYFIDCILLYISRQQHLWKCCLPQVLKFVCDAQRQWAITIYSFLCEKHLDVTNVTSILMAAHQLKLKDLKSACLSYIDDNLEVIASLPPANAAGSGSGVSLKQLNSLSSSVSSSLLDRIKVGTARRSLATPKKCADCYTSLKSKKVYTCEVCSRIVCDQCYGKEETFLPEIFKINKAIKTCNLCDKLINSVYNISNLAKYDDTQKLFKIPNYKFNLEQNLTEKQSSRYLKLKEKFASKKSDLVILSVSAEGLNVEGKPDVFYSIWSEEGGSLKQIFVSSLVKSSDPKWESEENLIDVKLSNTLYFIFYNKISGLKSKDAFLGCVEVEPLIYAVLQEEKLLFDVAVRYDNVSHLNPIKNKIKDVVKGSVTVRMIAMQKSKEKKEKARPPRPSRPAPVDLPKTPSKLDTGSVPPRPKSMSPLYVPPDIRKSQGGTPQQLEDSDSDMVSLNQSVLEESIVESEESD